LQNLGLTHYSQLAALLYLYRFHTTTIMTERLKSLLIYAAKVATGTIIVYTGSLLLHYKDIAWCLISVMLVMSPDGRESVPLSVTRIKANVVGACSGMLCLWIAPIDMWMMAFALITTLSFCYLFKLDSGIRSALAATIILMLHGEGKHVWDTAIERVIAVLAGCVVGLAITFIFHFKSQYQEITIKGPRIDEA